MSDNASTEEIIQRLNACISTGQGTLGGSLSVGIYDELAQAKLKRVIIDAIKDRNKPIEELNKTSENIERSITNGNDQNKTFNIALKKLIDEIKIKDEKDMNFFQRVSRFFGENIPIIGKVTKASMDFGKFIYDQQNQWLYWQQKLNNSGVFLQGGLSTLTEKANEAGLEINDLVNVLSTNSKTVAKLGGVYGDGTKAFSDLFKKIKPIGKELGIFNDELSKLTASVLDDYSVIYDSSAEGMQKLADRTANYIKWLDALSKATGKSKEQIDEETKQRANDLRWRIWMMDATNQKKAAIWTQMGLNLEAQQGLAFNLPNKETLALGISSPEMYKIAESVAKSKNDNDLENAIIEGKEIADQMKPFLNEYMDKARESGLLNIPEDDAKILFGGPELLLKLSGLSIEDLKKILHSENLTKEEKEDRDLTAARIDLETEKNKLYNKWIDTFKLNSEVTSNIVKLEENILGMLDNGLDMVRALLVPAKNSAQNLFNDTYNLFSDSDMSFFDRLWDFISKHPFFTTFLTLTTLTSIIPNGFTLISNILGIGINLLGKVITSIVALPNLLKPILSTSSSLGIGAAAYEGIINFGNFVQRASEKITNFSLYEYDKYKIKNSDASDEIKKRELENLYQRYNKTAQDLSNSSTIMQEYLPGLYIDGKEIKWSNGFIDNVLNESTNELNKFIDKFNEDNKKISDNFINSIKNMNISNQISNNEELSKSYNSLKDTMTQILDILKDILSEIGVSNELSEKSVAVQKERNSNEESYRTALEANSQ